MVLLARLPPLQRLLPVEPACALARLCMSRGLLSDATPCVEVVSMPAITSAVRSLQRAFQECPSITHAFAVKANPLRGVLKHMLALGCGAECASMGEVQHAMRAGFPSSRIVFDSPCKTTVDLQRAVEIGCFVNLDNPAEVAKLATVLASRTAVRQAGGGQQRLGPGTERARFGLRLNPLVGCGSVAATSTAHATSKFGMVLSASTRNQLTDLFRDNPFLRGVHVHVGSQGCSLQQLVQGVRVAEGFAQHVNRSVGWRQVVVLDIGGGLPVDYGVPGEARSRACPTFSDYASLLRQVVPSLWSGEFHVISEFGRSLLAKAGTVLSKVEAVKRVPVAEGELHHHAIAISHLSANQFLRTAYDPKAWPHRLSVISRHGHERQGPEPGALWSVAGPLCFSGDFVAREARLPRIEEGDVLALHDTGAYTSGMYSLYNSVPAWAVYAWDGKDVLEEIRSRIAPEQLLAWWG